MNLNILIIDGNEEESSKKLISAGIDPQYTHYKKVLQNILPNKLNITIIHPAISSNFLQNKINLDEFHGIVWTGSTLNIYDTSPSIIRQIDLAKTLLTKKNCIFGSCWGLQVAVTAAGGVVHKNPKGLEAVISKNICLNTKGEKHSMYFNKINNFDSLCWHYDEVKTIPNNSTILASNDHSKIQALTFKQNNSEFWGVQYHPEFTSYWMAGLMSIRKKILLEKKIFLNMHELNETLNLLKNLEKKDFISSDKIHNNILNFKNHNLEIKNWLNFILKN